MFHYIGQDCHFYSSFQIALKVANPDSGSDEEDAELRLFTFETCMELLEKPRLPDMLTRAVCWIIGEYAYLGQADFDQAAVIEVR